MFLLRTAIFLFHFLAKYFLIEMSTVRSGGGMLTQLVDLVTIRRNKEEPEPEWSQPWSRRQSLRKSFQERVKKTCGCEEDKRPS